MGFLGGLLMVAAGIGMGLYASHRLRRRVVFLETCGRLLQALGQEMSYTLQPIPVLWRRLASCETFAAFAPVRDTVAALENVPFSVAFSAALDAAREEGVLLPTSHRLLSEFAVGCGRTDLAGQQAHIAYYRTLLAAEEEQSRREWQERGRVYRVLGGAGGVALMLLLI